MAPPRKCTDEQYAFLKSHFDHYLECSTPAEHESFRTRVTAEFFVRFPERTALIAAGLLPAEDAIIQLSVDEVNAILGRAVTARKKVRLIEAILCY